ncbi:unnamed protein product (macronuclear) [Paramecium tetraurelia]|uniref:Protein kinase domain-containing protein n=1 Tax=Paramecium tetraurelia TaxID=5888 RepID=A0BB08_PARTE|nr:uncharacterized protein GSPATT00000160001 [Paramecium tetraurelia]CAK55725.1 unnamed protein product [Paramecium tetraurelia]|eukprot:XP_001423123.1 hypothetical protein (macronuclear) [Paramecium tetraurelia strain d4-2]
MKKINQQMQIIAGRNSLQESPQRLEKKSLKNPAKTVKTERPQQKGKTKLYDYFKKERNSLAQVVNNIRAKLKGSKSIDNMFLQTQKSERIKTSQQNVHHFNSLKQLIEQRVRTDDGNSSKRLNLKTKNLSLATVSIDLQKKEQQKQPSTTKQSYNQSPSNQSKPILNKSKSKDQYLFDLLKNAQMISNQYQQYFNLKQNKQSIQSDTSTNHRQSIEDMLISQKSTKGSPQPYNSKLSKQTEGDSKSLNQGYSKTESTPIIKQQSKIKTDDSLQYDPKKKLQIVLFYKQTKYYYLYDYVDQRTDNLYNFLLEQIASIEVTSAKVEGGGTGSTEDQYIQDELNKICQFITVNKNIPFDYYLSLPDLPLNIFQGITLQLQPLYSQLQETHRVGLKDFNLIKCIGVGGFSRVYLVKKKDNGQFYALKLIDKKFIFDNAKEVIVQNERDIMVRMENQYIIKLHYAFETRFYIAFVLEYSAGGELFYHLRKLKRLNEQEAQYYFVEVCIGMAYLHSQNIVYRDIKPENILLDLYGHMMLSDFGLSKPNMEDGELAYSFCGSPEYMAPEMLMKSGHSYLVDCYCLGALLYELVFGLPPFYSHDTQEIYNAILTENVQFPDYVQISDELKDLIIKLLQKDPDKRLGKKGGITEILTHVWFHNVDFEGIVNQTLPPPYKPEPQRYNFDEEEFNKGDAEFRKQYGQNLQYEFQNVDKANYELENFYYARSQQEFKNRTKLVNTSKLVSQIVQQEPISPNKQMISKVKHSPSESKSNVRPNIKSEAHEYFKKHNLFTRSSQILKQSLKQGHTYSKTLQQPSMSIQDLKKLKQLFDQSKQLLSSDRVTTIPDQNNKHAIERVKTEQIGNLPSPKTTTHSAANKLAKFSKLFGSEKRKK